MKSVVNGVTTLFVSAQYQVESGQAIKYYMAGAQTIAVRKNGTLSFILSDHLGSTSLITTSTGTPVSGTLYKPWGETRYTSGTLPTPYHYTGQREEASFGLYFYNARWYDPTLGRFAQADTIIPPGLHGLDRFAYVSNNPVRFTDPTGHIEACDNDDWACQTHWDEPITYDDDEYSTPLTEEQAEVVDFLIEASGVVLSVFFEPLDWMMTYDDYESNGFSPWMLAGLFPFIPSSAGKYGDDVGEGIYQVFYRGDDVGLTNMTAKATGISFDHADNLLANGDWDKLMLDHAMNSSTPPSPFISVTTDRRVAEFWAEIGGGEVYKILTNRAIRNPHGLAGESEWLVPLIIFADEIIK